MSRLGKQPVIIPSGVTVAFDRGVLTVKGPKGELTRPVTDDVTVVLADNTVQINPVAGKDRAAALWGTFAAHLHNMIKGVTEGFSKQLEVEGVGYRAGMQGTNLVLSVGFSHPVEIAVPAELSVVVEKNLITISGADKEQVGQFAANVRETRKPEPYKGKGIHYVGEYIIRKQGKKAVG